MIKIKINGKQVSCDENKTLLTILRERGINIPTLCYQEGLEPESRCRLCVVEINGKLKTSCSTYPSEGMNVLTETDKVKRARRVNTELLVSKHFDACFIKNENHDLSKIVRDIRLENVRFSNIKKCKISNYRKNIGTSVLRDNSLCINCGRCVAVCDKIQATWAIDFAGRGYREHVTPYFEKDLSEMECINCGQCILSCPVGAIYEREYLNEVLKVLKDKKKHVIVQTAPSIRASIGEEFGMKPGSLVTGKMVAALRKCKFDKVFDTDLGADMTIVEEGSELLERIKKGGPFPLITSCCPGWIKFMEHFYPNLIKNVSSCKSPHQMFGALAKSYYAKTNNINPKDIVVVSIMPCTAKKFESQREELKGDVDYVLTTREAAKLIRNFGIDFINLKDEEFDPALGISTGAGAIFGATGGVMEAALRTAYEFGTGSHLKNIEFEKTRGLEGIKCGYVMMNGKKIKFAVAHGLANARRVLERKDEFHFIEIMACPGGCIGGGGQPKQTSKEILKKRIEAIYRQDKKLKIRKSHENPILKKIYKEFLEKPLSKKAHKLLHTKYIKRGV